MDESKVYAKLTTEDIEEINKNNPKSIKIVNTKSIDLELLSALNPEIKIEIVGDQSEAKSASEPKNVKSRGIPTYSYTKDELINIITTLNSLEIGIEAHPEWTELEKAVYLYAKIIALYSSLHGDYLVKSDQSLRAILDLSGDPKSLALIYDELCARNGLKSRYVENTDRTHGFNEIEIDGTYYPVDVSQDIQESAQEPGSIMIHNFGKNPEFYAMPTHNTGRENLRYEMLPREIVQRSLEIVTHAMVEEAKELVTAIRPEEEPRPDVTIRSKELKGIFEGDRITEKQLAERKPIKISLTDENIADVVQDVRTVTRHYPELVQDIVLENTTSKHINMQKIVDAVFEERTQNNTGKPIYFRIVTDNPEDFQIDFSKAPAIGDGELMDDDPAEKIKKPFVTFAHLNRSDPRDGTFINNALRRFPTFSGCYGVGLENINCSGIDLNVAGIGRITDLSLKGRGTLHVGDIQGKDSIRGLTYDNVSEAELLTLPAFNETVRLSIFNENLRNRPIFSELKMIQDRTGNIPYASISIWGCRLNDITDIEAFDGIIGELNLCNNDLSIDDLRKIEEQLLTTEKSRVAQFYMLWNPRVTAAIAAQLGGVSTHSKDFIRKYFEDSKDLKFKDLEKYNFNEIEKLLAYRQHNVPYYIEDAHIVRDKLHILQNPMMVWDIGDLSKVDLTQGYFKGGTILLTPQQAEDLISSGTTIPNTIKINLLIQNVKDLSNDQLDDLNKRLQAKGMTINGVQKIDGKNSTDTDIEPFTTEQYKTIRTALEILTSDIDPNWSDLDKLAVIYQRFKQSVQYDHNCLLGKQHGANHDDFMRFYYARLYSARNVLGGVSQPGSNGMFAAVCAFYSDGLTEALKMVGIESKRIGGHCGKDSEGNLEGGHSWSQVRIRDELGQLRWFNCDLTWDAQHYYEFSDRDWIGYTLVGDNTQILRPDGASIGTTFHKKHEFPCGVMEPAPRDYGRALVRNAFERAKARCKGFKLREMMEKIEIPDDPELKINFTQEQTKKMRDEFELRKMDMYAKYYGDRKYRAEYLERMKRYKSHIISKNDGTFKYKSVEDYPERKEDEKFLLLDKYKEILERVSRYKAGDVSVYEGTAEQSKETFKRDQAFVETFNYNFNGHRNTRKDLQTLGKYGERIPYLPKQQGFLRNTGRILLNTGLLLRNGMTPIFWGFGKYIAAPIHNAVYGDSETSPFRNNRYHRMVARRDYYTEQNNADNPNHPIINGIKARFQAVFNAKEGNEAVLRAGAKDIRKNIEAQARQKVVAKKLRANLAIIDVQIAKLQQELAAKPGAQNAGEVKAAIQRKTDLRDKIIRQIAGIYAHKIGTKQTDAVSERQHAVASKEVTTVKTTIIKGLMEGVALRFAGPQIQKWLTNRSKTTKTTTELREVPEEYQAYVAPRYRYENVPQTSEGLTGGGDTLSEVMSQNAGKKVTGFYSVWGGERKPKIYTLTGKERITAIFEKSAGKGGDGLSDVVGLKAPTLTDGTFAKDLLDGSGYLRQEITVSQLVEALQSSQGTAGSIDKIYVSVGDRCWVKLSDLVPGLGKTEMTGVRIQRILEVPAHLETRIRMVTKPVTNTVTIERPAFRQFGSRGMDIIRGVVAEETVRDVVENVRPTTTKVKSNKPTPRDYEFDDDMDDIPTSVGEYRRQRGSR